MGWSETWKLGKNYVIWRAIKLNQGIFFLLYLPILLVQRIKYIGWYALCIELLILDTQLQVLLQCFALFSFFFLFPKSTRDNHICKQMV